MKNGIRNPTKPLDISSFLSQAFFPLDLACFRISGHSLTLFDQNSATIFLSIIYLNLVSCFPSMSTWTRRSFDAPEVHIRRKANADVNEVWFRIAGEVA